MRLPTLIVHRLRSVLGQGAAVALHEPSFNGDELSNVTKAIESTFVSSVGEFVDQFEVDLARYTGVERAVVVVNGTCALQIALESLV